MGGRVSAPRPVRPTAPLLAVAPRPQHEQLFKCGRLTIRWRHTNAGAADGSCYSLLSSVANRIQVLDLQSHTVRTPLPVEASSNIVYMALEQEECTPRSFSTSSSYPEMRLLLQRASFAPVILLQGSATHHVYRTIGRREKRREILFHKRCLVTCGPLSAHISILLLMRTDISARTRTWNSTSWYLGARCSHADDDMKRQGVMSTLLAQSRILS